MMKKSHCFLMGMVLSFGLLCGCTQTEQGATAGALAGGAIGGIIGHQSGETGAGAAIGAAGGAVLGGLIGHSQEEKAKASQHVQVCPQGHEVDVSGFPPGSSVRCPICNNTFVVQ